MKIAIRLRAKNDVNGNPRRLFVVLEEGAGLVDVIDEGYNGDSELLAKHGISAGVDINIEPREYQRIRRERARA